MKNNLKIIYAFIGSYICMFMFAFCLQYVYGEQLFTFWYDAVDYFDRGKIIYEASFDISSIDGYRGVVFPFILACVHALGGKIFFYLLSPLFFCFFTCICVSLLFSKDVLLNSLSWKKLFLFNGIVTVLFIGIWLFPLADLWACFFLSISLLISKISVYSKNISFFFYVHYFLECSYIFPII